MKTYINFVNESAGYMDLVRQWVEKKYNDIKVLEFSTNRLDFAFINLRKVITFEIVWGVFGGFELFVFIEEGGGFQKMVYSGKQKTINDVIYMIGIEADYFLKQYAK